MTPKSNNLAAYHPLQRLDSPSRGFSALVHVAGIISFSLNFKYLLDFPTMVNRSYGWHFQFLTILGLAVATLTFICGLLADITLSPRLFLMKNTLSLCSAPLEVIISILYWGISAIDKKLVVPHEINIAPLADFGFHSAPSLFLLTDLLFLSPPWTIRAWPTMALSSIIAVMYWVWVEQCYKYNGYYPYPLFALLDTKQRIALFTLAAALMTGTTVMLQWLYGRINGSTAAEKRSVPGNVKGE